MGNIVITDDSRNTVFFVHIKLLDQVQYTPVWVLCIFKHFLHWVYIETPWFPSIEQSIAIHCLWTLVINAKFLSFKLHGITDKHWSQNINHNGLECYNWSDLRFMIKQNDNSTGS